MTPDIARKTCQAPDGVTLVYSVAGEGEPALLFVHGGMADRSFYESQLRALSDRWRVIAVDLAGHGASGANRTTWGIPAFGADVKAVADAELLKRVIVFGNSLGGPRPSRPRSFCPAAPSAWWGSTPSRIWARPPRPNTGARQRPTSASAPRRSETTTRPRCARW